MCMGGSLNQQLECKSATHNISLNNFIWILVWVEIQNVLTKTSDKFFENFFIRSNDQIFETQIMGLET